jgi:hypothetical protein
MELPLQTLIDVCNKLIDFIVSKKLSLVFFGGWLTYVMELPLQTLIDVWNKLNFIV